MAVSECPECTFHIPMPPDLQVGDVLECPDCGTRLKVKSVYPPIFEVAGEE
jgi:lysine biosynthesis protein LysW